MVCSSPFEVKLYHSKYWDVSRTLNAELLDSWTSGKGSRFSHCPIQLLGFQDEYMARLISFGTFMPNEVENPPFNKDNLTNIPINVPLSSR